MAHPPGSTGAESAGAAEKTKALLATVWKRNLPVIEDRLAVLDLAATSSPLPEDLRSKAHAVAHKLSGSLGMFGFSPGTEVARELEQLLNSPAPDPAVLKLLTRQLRDILFPAS